MEVFTKKLKMKTMNTCQLKRTDIVVIMKSNLRAFNYGELFCHNTQDRNEEKQDGRKANQLNVKRKELKRLAKNGVNNGNQF